MKIATALVTMAFLAGLAHAEVVSSSPSHYELRHEARSDLDTEAMWARIAEPSRWWLSDHTYSGDSANLTLDLQAGGLWREDWDGGSVEHGRVVYVSAPETLRLDAPFGPLQALGVSVIWEISVSADEAGSRVVFTERASGSQVSDLDELAPAVDYVKGEALASLVAGN